MPTEPIAQSPGDHCFQYVKHNGTPVGNVVELGGMQTYISESKESGSKKVILFYSDIYGPLFVNNQLLMDFFASNGFTVLGPEYFMGDLVGDHNEPGFVRADWFKVAEPRTRRALPKWLEAVVDKYGKPGETKYCVVGYCFGAPFTFELGTTDHVVAAAVAHPALLTEEHVKNVKVPMLFSCAETDHTFPLEKRRLAEDILVERKASYHFSVFSGVAHGFAIRGDPEEETARWSKEESARGILSWFARFTQ